MPFREKQYVRMLIPSIGDDADDIEREYPAGTAGFIDEIDGRGILHVIVGSLGSDESIVQCFDKGLEAETAMEPLHETVA